MSVTFYLKSNERLSPPCPHCRATGDQPCSPEQAGCATCGGFGGDPVDSTPSLNCANTNARILLGDLLGYEIERFPDLCGEIDPQDLLDRLVKARAVARQYVQAPTREGNFYDHGLSIEQIDRYLVTLAQIGVIASRRREPVLFS
jgi:hypothetical protein